MNTETIDKLYLELSHLSKAKTAREIELEDLLTSAHAIAKRKGEDTAWDRYSDKLTEAGINPVTAKTFRVLDGDEPSADKHSTVYVKTDTSEEVRVEFTHVTEGLGTPHEANRERQLSTTERARAIERLSKGGYTTVPSIED